MVRTRSQKPQRFSRYADAAGHVQVRAHREGWINMDHMVWQRRRRVRMECAFGHLTVAASAEEERQHNDPPAHRLGVSSGADARSLNGDMRSELPIVSRRPRARWPELVVGRERLTIS
jgi:hypothetical protein